MRILQWICVLALISGCTPTGASFTEITLPNSKDATLIIYREDLLFYAGRRFPIRINGQERCSLRNGGFLVVPDANGHVTIASSLTDQPGISIFTLDVKPSETYYIRISLDTGKAYAAASGGLVGALSAATSSGGPFTFTQLTPEQAKRELQDLRQDCVS